MCIRDRFPAEQVAVRAEIVAGDDERNGYSDARKESGSSQTGNGRRVQLPVILRIEKPPFEGYQ